MKYVLLCAILVAFFSLVGCSAQEPPRPDPAAFSSAPTPAVSIAGIHLRRLTAEEGIDFLNPLSAHWTRRNINWSLIEPNEGERAWEAVASLEEEFVSASTQGLEVIAVIEHTPAWALKPGFNCGAVSPDKLQALGRTLTDIVTRYKSPPFGIGYWELWNEPDAFGTLGCWGDPADGEYYGGSHYGEMLKIAYSRIKEADPEAQVLVGGLLLDCDPRQSTAGKECISSNFFEGILKAGAGPYFDGVSFHAYDYYSGGPGQYGNPNWASDWKSNGPVLTVKASFLNELLAAYQIPGKYLINTEVALLCGQTGEEEICQQPDFSATKSAYIIQSYTSALAAGLRANIWFRLTGWRGSGLMSSTLEPEAAYAAFRFAAQTLGQAVYDQPVDQYPGLYGQALRLGEEKIWVLWSTSGERQSIQLPTLPTAIFDPYGNPRPAVTSIEIGMEPVVIVWDQ